MAKMQRVVVILLVMTLILSAVSVVFNLIIYKMKSSDYNYNSGPTTSSNVGNIGLIVEGNNANSGGGNGG